MTGREIAQGSVVQWLATPLSGAAHHALKPWVYWHARSMVLGWSVLLPLGMLIARFFKIIPGKDWPRVLDCKFWWRTHVWPQSFGVGAMTLALALAFVAGWTLVAIGVLQVLGALLRGSKGGPTEETLRGDHYDMTPRRVVFEAVHKHLGWAAPPIAVGATGLGLAIVDAPRWMALTLACWWDPPGRRLRAPAIVGALPRYRSGHLGARPRAPRKSAQTDRLGCRAAMTQAPPARRSK